MRAFIDYPLAVLAGLLPKRYWNNFDLPVENVALVSALLTFVGGAALGITGFFDYMAYVLVQRQFTLPPFMLAVFIGYVLFTPRGLVSLYLLLSGLVRMISGWIDQPDGDPILTLIDSAWRRLRKRQRDTRVRHERLELERIDEPDRRYDGKWAGLTGVDFVIVSARRKPGWVKGTYVITSDGWYVLGEPFDRPMPNGLRTVYPLTEHRTLEVLRKGVAYQLPPLRSNPAEAGHHGPSKPAKPDTTDRGIRPKLDTTDR